MPLDFATSSHVATCMSSMHVHAVKFIIVLMAFTFIFMPVISSSLTSLSLFLDSQSAMYRSGLGLSVMKPCTGVCEA